MFTGGTISLCKPALEAGQRAAGCLVAPSPSCPDLLGGPSSPFDEVLHSALQKKRRGVRSRQTPARIPTACPTPAASLRPPPPLQKAWLCSLTFRIRFFSMLSTAKTCSPTAGNSMLGGCDGAGKTRTGGGGARVSPAARQLFLPAHFAFPDN